MRSKDRDHFLKLSHTFENTGAMEKPKSKADALNAVKPFIKA